MLYNVCLPLIERCCSGRLQFHRPVAARAPEAALPVSAYAIDREPFIIERDVLSMFRKKVVAVMVALIMYTATLILDAGLAVFTAPPKLDLIVCLAVVVSPSLFVTRTMSAVAHNAWVP